MYKSEIDPRGVKGSKLKRESFKVKKAVNDAMRNPTRYYSNN
jgi:hypothetical protein